MSAFNKAVLSCDAMEGAFADVELFEDVGIAGVLVVSDYPLDLFFVEGFPAATALFVAGLFPAVWVGEAVLNGVYRQTKELA